MALYKSDKQLAKRIYKNKVEGRSMEFNPALSLCDKMLASWLKLMAPAGQWFKADGGEYELFVERMSRGDFKGRISARKVN
jgi:hypothetical protein